MQLVRQRPWHGVLLWRRRGGDVYRCPPRSAVVQAFGRRRQQAQLLAAGHASDGGLDPSACLLDLLHIQPRPRDPSLPDTADNHTDHVKRRPVRLRSLPVPLAPDGVTIGRRAQEFRAEVRHPVEHRGPVASHLVAPSKRSIGMGGLLALVLCLKAIKKRLQIVGVHRGIEALHNRTRTALSAHGHERSLNQRPFNTATDARGTRQNFRNGTSRLAAGSRTPSVAVGAGVPRV